MLEKTLLIQMNLNNFMQEKNYEQFDTFSNCYLFQLQKKMSRRKDMYSSRKKSLLFMYDPGEITDFHLATKIWTVCQGIQHIFENSGVLFPTHTYEKNGNKPLHGHTGTYEYPVATMTINIEPQIDTSSDIWAGCEMFSESLKTEKCKNKNKIRKME